MKIKPARLIATAVLVVLLATSGLAMAVTLTTADDGFHLEGYDLSEYSSAPASGKNFARDVIAKLQKKGKSDSKKILFSVAGKPGNGSGWPGYVPANPGMSRGRPDHVPANPGMSHGRPDHVPPLNPPIDTPAFYNGLVNAPVMMPASVPDHTLPGSGFGEAVVPIPAAAWLFGSGLLGLIGMARRRKQ